jgi:pilus assembly protein CpaE
MTAKTKVLLASRSKPALADLQAKLFRESRYELQTRYIENGHADPLHGVSAVPDVVIMALTERGLDDLSELLKQQPAPQRPPMIVTAQHGDAQTMRLAMQAGARDFLPGALSTQDLVASIDRAAAQSVKGGDTRASSLIAVVNAKGGSGATFVASNVAHIMRVLSGRPSALVSLDMQFESLAPFFDVTLKHGLLDVLEAAHELDAVALDAFMTQHESGLRLLAPRPESSFASLNDRSAELATLLDKMTAQYERVLVDVPRRVDRYTEALLERAERVVLVVQQTVSHLRDAKRMMQIFRQHGVGPEQVLVVVNRFEKNSLIAMDDVQRALPGSEVVSIPSDFNTVAESINLGVPMYDHARGSAVTKALTALAKTLGPPAEQLEAGGLLGKALSNLLRKDTWSRA